MKALSDARAARHRYETDKRRRKRAHRLMARHLLKSGGFFNGFSARGSSMHEVAVWHLGQARALAMQ